MTPPNHGRPPAFDAKSIQATIERALAAAGLRPQPQAQPQAQPAPPTPAMPGVAESLKQALAAARAARPGRAGPAARHAPAAPVHPGRFETHRFSNEAGSRGYKLYVPAAPAGATARPVVVMLHGCTQSADDFAAGTQMNRLAEAHGLLVVYPEQPQQANASKCWNWFQPQDQRRGAGEPWLLAGITAQVLQRHGADPRRVFVAGLSAGAAMAVVLGETYPELFAAVGVHSGLPFGSAHDIPSALAAMKGGRSGLPGLQPGAGPAGAPPRQAASPLPLIVFHGDRDTTVQASNGARIVQQALQAHAARAGAAPLQHHSDSGVAPGGQRYSRSVHADDEGRPHIEHWTLHGAGHAWSGGHAAGSYTDTTGPDASAEMLRFFLATTAPRPL